MDSSARTRAPSKSPGGSKGVGAAGHSRRSGQRNDMHTTARTFLLMTVIGLHAAGLAGQAHVEAEGVGSLGSEHQPIAPSPNIAAPAPPLHERQPSGRAWTICVIE